MDALTSYNFGNDSLIIEDFSNITSSEDRGETSILNVVLFTSGSWFLCIAIFCFVRCCASRSGVAKKHSFWRMSSSISAFPVRHPNGPRELDESNEPISWDNVSEPKSTRGSFVMAASKIAGFRSSFRASIRNSITIPKFRRESIWKLMGLAPNEAVFMYDPSNGAFPNETQHKWLIGTLHYAKILLEYTAEERKQIVSKMRQLILPDKHILIQQKTSGTDLYILESGMLDVFVDTKKVNTIYPGWAFGELGFLFNSPRSSTCITVKKSIVWVLTRSDLESVVQNAFDEIAVEMSDEFQCSPVEHQSSALSALALDLRDDYKKDDSDSESLNQIRHSAMIVAGGGSQLSLHTNFSSSCKSPMLKRMISGDLLKEIAQNHYVGVPEIVLETLDAYGISERCSFSSAISSISTVPGGGAPSLRCESVVNLPHLFRQGTSRSMSRGSIRRPSHRGSLPIPPNLKKIELPSDSQKQRRRSSIFMSIRPDSTPSTQHCSSLVVFQPSVLPAKAPHTHETPHLITPPSKSNVGSFVFFE